VVRANLSIETVKGRTRQKQGSYELVLTGFKHHIAMAELIELRRFPIEIHPIWEVSSGFRWVRIYISTRSRLG
jgi:hypothetical protein